MGKSIKRSVSIRVACALVAVLLFSVAMTINILSLESSQKVNAQASDLLSKAQSAETAHYRWSTNLSNALYAGTQFTGSMDPTTCELGKWLYSDIETDDQTVMSLRAQIEPLHKELHQSASTALGMSTAQAQQYYQTTIQSNLTTLVGLLEQVVERGAVINNDATTRMETTIKFMHATSIIGLGLSLIALISLVVYVSSYVIKPILQITQASQPLQEGLLELDLGYSSQNELGQLASTLERSMDRIHSYVEDINRIMGELSDGNFDVHKD